MTVSLQTVNRVEHQVHTLLEDPSKNHLDQTQVKELKALDKMLISLQNDLKRNAQGSGAAGNPAPPPAQAPVPAPAQPEPQQQTQQSSGSTNNPVSAPAGTDTLGGGFDPSSLSIEDLIMLLDAAFARLTAGSGQSDGNGSGGEDGGTASPTIGQQVAALVESVLPGAAGVATGGGSGGASGGNGGGNNGGSSNPGVTVNTYANKTLGPGALPAASGGIPHREAPTLGTYTSPGMGKRKQELLAAADQMVPPATDDEKAIALAIANQETNCIDTNYAPGDGKTGDSANLTPFKMNAALVREIAPNVNQAELHNDLGQATQVLITGLRTMGVDGFLLQNRGGDGAFNGSIPKERLNDYVSGIKDIAADIKADPSYLTNDERIQKYITPI